MPGLVRRSGRTRGEGVLGIATLDIVGTSPPKPTRPTPTGRVVDVRAGPAVSVRWRGRRLVTAASKQSISGPVWVTSEGLTGDEQGNRKVHGGPDKALLLYCHEHYQEWHSEGFPVPVGGFFENLTVSGVGETDAHLGDVWRLGDVVIQVTQPRRPCRTLADRWDRPDLPELVQQTGRTGWYARVLQPGPVAAGDALLLVDRPAGSVSAAEANRVMNLDRADEAGIRLLLAAPELPRTWRDTLVRRLAGHLEDDSARLHG